MKVRQNDPIVEEMRANGRAFAAKHDNNISRMCKALRENQQKSGRKVISRQPKRIATSVES